MERLAQKKKNSFVKYYDTVIIALILSGLIFFGIVFLPSQEETNIIVKVIFFTSFAVYSITQVMLFMGMAYNSYKIKRYSWLAIILSTIVLGLIIPFIGLAASLIFYFSVLRKESKKKKD